MQTVLALALLVATAESALARPPDPTSRVLTLESEAAGPLRQRAPLPSVPEYLLPRFLLPHFLGYDESPRLPPPRPLPDHDWLNKEIDRINQMEEDDEPARPYDDDFSHWIAQDPYLQRMLENPVKTSRPKNFNRDPPSITYHGINPPRRMSASLPGIPILEIQEVQKRPGIAQSADDDLKNTFALTPLDKGYYDHERTSQVKSIKGIEFPKIIEETKAAMLIEPPRQTRQNPNLSRTKTLVTENIDKLKAGLGSHEERLMSDKGGREHMHPLDGSSDPIDPLYFAAVGGAIAAAVSLTVFGFTFAWYTLAKKAKAAADVDYPAYGVTGPTVDSSGDRKLAQSAHMYHYQHQKQQIIAMERMDLEQRLGSVSDPESEEENEEGDYTVYECPGFATTGDMEVKNPLFSDDPTPATPGKCEVVKPQPKD